ncbi:growth arrest and DNA damage-inducible proteins-interacting protein 1 [Sitophilus oryzae]|uniref:Large ribosomal subunit protein mL64 n=1 Tax=Sitophilus oryzae TaxID=7048 RepID=A0A6J2XM75_SITOR|nr:growth arrest and DNA damage-inducible proteins-interacting protein 1 [Sitophilus oryzae]
MIRRDFFKRILLIQRNVSARYSSSDLNQINIQKLEAEQSTEVVDEALQQREAELEQKRNKSRLKDNHRRILNDEDPFPEPELWYQGTLKYVRRSYGRYGASSGIDPAYCWPIKQELMDAIEYEQIKYPYTIGEMAEKAKLKRAEKEQSIMNRQRDISKKLEKLEQWKLELQQKIIKKETEANEAKARRERLIEEVRRHFGYAVDPKDEKFKELLEKREKEQRKEMKEARKKAKEERATKKLLQSTKTNVKQEEPDDTKQEKLE